MNICIVTETYPPEINGVAHTLSKLVEGLVHRGHHVTLVRPKLDKTPQVRPPDGKFTVRMVPALPLPGYDGLQFGLPSFRAFRWNGSARPEVMYVATEGPLGWWAVRHARRNGIPVISGFHTNFDSYSRFYGVGLLESLIFYYLRWLHNRTSMTLVPTEALRKRMEDRGVTNARVMSRGVDRRFFSPERRDESLRRKWKKHPDDRIVIYVGRIAREKNVDLVLDAFNRMKSVNPRLKLVFVGDGPSYEEMKRLNPEIIFAGLKVGEPLAAHYASGDIFLFPSLTETFGNVILEAMASGLAVAAFDYAAAATHIRDGETGILVPFGDSGAFINAATSLANMDSSSISRIRTNARQYAETVDWDSIIDRFEGLLTESMEAF